VQSGYICAKYCNPSVLVEPFDHNVREVPRCSVSVSSPSKKKASLPLYARRMDHSNGGVKFLPPFQEDKTIW